MKFAGENAETKNALFNWGLGAVVWLVVGRILERLDPALSASSARSPALRIQRSCRR